MPFAYYQRLSPARKRIYRRSDEITSIPLPRAEELRPLTHELAAVLDEEDRREAERICQQLADGLTERLEVPSVHVTVLKVRPRDGWGELHGLYEPSEDEYLSRISLWMRTAQRAQVVAFRTFLRTLLHELGHHLDYELFDLEETFHTEGFYKRESSLFNQLVDKEKPGR
ncbi:MAG: hypothetical protein EP299_06495 [Acidobacteria bacterium]|nr:MAG: hypothetical protein EP299_06495 [Acidobacteriota bacterium]